MRCCLLCGRVHCVFITKSCAACTEGVVWISLWCGAVCVCVCGVCGVNVDCAVLFLSAAVLHLLVEALYAPD